MRPTTKGVHTWWNDLGNELAPGVMPVRRNGHTCACWNDFTGKWEFGTYNGWIWETVQQAHLPPGFKAYLLILGIT